MSNNKSAKIYFIAGVFLILVLAFAGEVNAQSKFAKDARDRCTYDQKFCPIVSSLSAKKAFAPLHKRTYGSGDLNCDAEVSKTDVECFMDALIGEEHYSQKYSSCKWMNADTNGDGRVNFNDIDSFTSMIDKRYKTKGDMNCDWNINKGDTDYFVNALIGKEVYAKAQPDCNWMNADTNNDGVVNFDDIDSFTSMIKK